MAVTSRHDSLEYLYRQRDSESARQRHAEVMAWAGVAVFVAVMVAVAVALPHPDTTLWVFRTGVEVALALAFLIALGYTRRQFNARAWACRIAAGYSRAIAAVVEGVEGEDTGDQRQPLVDDAALEAHPELVRRFVPATCPEARSTELLAYALLPVAFVVASVVALSLAPSRPSAITSGNAATFRVGQFGSVTVTATGAPAPRLSESGALPVGTTFADHGNGTATLSGMPEPGSAGRYPVEITAANGVAPDAVQSFTLSVVGPGTGPRTRARRGASVPAGGFTSPSSATATRGVPFTFEVTTTGSPPPHIKEAGVLPRGLVFHDNGDGTGMVSGVPQPRRLGVFPLRFKAVFGNGRSRQVAVQRFALDVR